MQYRFQSAKELSDSLAMALGVSDASPVAAAPPGLREASLHDYSLSVSDGATPQESHTQVSNVWPLTQTGKLLAAGVLGVIIIASSVTLQNSRESKKPAQTLVTPSAALVAPTASPEAPPPAPTVVKTEPTNQAPSPTATVAATPIESLQKAGEKKDDTSRRERPAKDSVQHSSPKPDKQNKPTTPPPTKSKGVDFGI
jgi:hypothetical protein